MLADLLKGDGLRYTRVKGYAYLDKNGIAIPTRESQKLETFVRQNIPLIKNPDGKEYLFK